MVWFHKPQPTEPGYLGWFLERLRNQTMVYCLVPQTTTVEQTDVCTMGWFFAQFGRRWTNPGKNKEKLVVFSWSFQRFCLPKSISKPLDNLADHFAPVWTTSDLTRPVLHPILIWAARLSPQPAQLYASPPMVYVCSDLVT